MLQIHIRQSHEALQVKSDNSVRPQRKNIKNIYTRTQLRHNLNNYLPENLLVFVVVVDHHGRLDMVDYHSALMNLDLHSDDTDLGSTFFHTHSLSLSLSHTLIHACYNRRTKNIFIKSVIW